LHLGGNMLFLWVFGDNVEDAMGHVRFLIFYLLTGIGAVALQVAVAPDSTVPTVGASRAISGVMAAYLVLFPGARVRVLVFLGIFITVIALPALVVIGFWIILQFIAGYAALGPETTQTGGVAYWAHIGGFLAGILLVFIFRDPRAMQRLRRAQR
jgi:membrane associated rhomboid family serine protease